MIGKFLKSPSLGLAIWVTAANAGHCGSPLSAGRLVVADSTGGKSGSQDTTSSGGSSQGAGTLSYGNILGKWCGVTSNPNLTNYLFTRDTLTVNHLSNKQTVVLKLDNYEFSGAMVIVHYFAKSAKAGSVAGNQRVDVTFGEFSADGKTMAQVKTSGSPAYLFVRC
jgi:hypothetical protein